MRKLHIDLEELAAAMEDHSFAFAWYLDTQTGQLVVLPGEAGDPDAWPEEELEKYERMMAEDPDRFEPVPRISAHEGYRWMARFAETVEAPELRELLRLALDGKGTFGRFRRALSDHPDVRERWLRYHDERLRAELDDWLEGLGIEPT